MGGEEEELRAQASQGGSNRGQRGRGRGGVTRGQGRVWSIQNAELWGASEEALEFVAGQVGEEQAEREDDRRRRMRPVLSDGDRKALEEAGNAGSLKEAMEKVTGVFEGAYEAMGGAVGALREESLEWKRDMLAHLAATDRQTESAIWSSQVQR